MIWDCPCLEGARYEADLQLRELPHHLLPPLLKLGIPPTFGSYESDLLWYDSDDRNHYAISQWAKLHPRDEQDFIQKAGK